MFGLRCGDLTSQVAAADAKLAVGVEGRSSERTAKYNQLLRIEEELGDACTYAGEHFRKPL